MVPKPQRLFVSPRSVRLARHNLLVAKAHPHFIGYLCVCWTAHQSGVTKGLKVDFKKFHDDFLIVSGALASHPYVTPFPYTSFPFFNKNPAGSYAPSSLRDVAPLRRAVNIDGSGRDTSYSLVPGHASQAKSSMLRGNPLPVASLAVFLYRNYGLFLEAPKCIHIVQIFREEFGFRQEIRREREEFNVLFQDDSTQFDERDLFADLEDDDARS